MKKINDRFEQMYVSYFAKMKRFACEYVTSEEDAENIVHDIFTEMWEKKEVLSLSVNIVAVLFVSVKNRCIDHLRRRAVEQQAAVHLQKEHDIALQMKLNSLEVLDDDLFTEENIEKIVTKAIASLPEKCREIFIKSKIEGKKQKEIACELNITVNTVETQMGIAYKKLKEELKYLFPVFILMLSLIQERFFK